MKKTSKQRMLNQLGNKKILKDISKAKELGKIKVTREDLYSEIAVINSKLDALFMSNSAITAILVEKGLVTFEEYKKVEQDMHYTLKFVRRSMVEARSILGKDASMQDIHDFTHEKAEAFKINKDILIYLFGVKESESKIIKPNQQSIVVPGR
jgi:hypothetical protein